MVITHLDMEALGCGLPYQMHVMKQQYQYF